MLPDRASAALMPRPARAVSRTDNGAGAASRRKILALKPALIVPGHGDPFVPDETTPI